MKIIKASRGEEVFVSDEDYPLLSRFKWHVTRGRCKYAKTNAVIGGLKVSLAMHRLVTQFSRKMVDHINGNTLDNRRENLRLATGTQNGANTRRTNKTGYRGVFAQQAKCQRPFGANIRFKNKLYPLGFFYTAKDAALAYDLAAIEYYGEFATLNFPARARKLLDAKAPYKCGPDISEADELFGGKK